MAKKYVVVDGFCSTQKKPIKLQCEVRNDGYAIIGSFLSSGDGDGEREEVDGSFYASHFTCTLCGNEGIIKCSCGALICGKPGEEKAVCPSCGKTLSINWGRAVDAKGASSRQ